MYYEYFVKYKRILFLTLNFPLFHDIGIFLSDKINVKIVDERQV